ncbi:MAG: hypothetical protein RIC16_03230 [Rhodospirillales bacterium]
MRRFRGSVMFVLGLGLLVSACVTDSGTNRARTHGAFLMEDGIVTGTYDEFNAQLAEAIPDPTNINLAIFNHGISHGGQGQVCDPEDEVPFVFKYLFEQIPNTVVYSFCSDEIGRGSNASTSEQTFYKRGEEIAELLDTFAEYGVDPKRIILLGHSGGASAILSTAARFPEKFNYFVASAPGYGYAWTGRGIHDIHLAPRYHLWKAHYEKADRLDGLVLGFGDDTYSPIDEMLFLKEIEGVEFRAFPDANCRGVDPHAFIYTSCFGSEDRQWIYDVISDRLSRVGELSSSGS